MNGQRRSPRKPQRGLSRRAMIIVGLAVFIAVDTVLIALALGWGREEPRAAGSISPTQSTQPEEASDQAEPKDETKPNATIDSPQVTPRLLSVTSDAVAWRSEGGTCHERGSLELTVDGGETWGAAYPSTEAFGRPLWLSGADYTAVQSTVASGTDCEAQGVRTYDSGASWVEDNQVVANSVLVHPSDSSLVIWGGDVIEGPCDDLNQVSVTAGVTGVICGDGDLWRSPAGGSEWTQSGVRNAVALSGSDGRWIAAVESNDCEGLSLVELDETLVEPLACSPADPEADTAIDTSGNALWLWTGDQVLVSTDLGRSFN